MKTLVDKNLNISISDLNMKEVVHLFPEQSESHDVHHTVHRGLVLTVPKEL